MQVGDTFIGPSLPPQRKGAKNAKDLPHPTDGAGLCHFLFVVRLFVLVHVELQLFTAVRALGRAFVEHLLVNRDDLTAGGALDLVERLVAEVKLVLVAEIVLVILVVLVFVVVLIIQQRFEQ